LHIPKLEETRVVEAVKRLYLDRLLSENRLENSQRLELPNRSADIPVRSNVNDSERKLSSHAGATSPSPIGWERAGVRALVQGTDTPTRAKELLLSQRIAAAVDHVFRTQPQRAAAFVTRLDFYERWLARLNISDEALACAPQKRKLAAQSFVWAVLAVVGAPIALYGWIHRLIPCAIIEWAKHKFTLPDRRKAQASTTAIAAGIVAFSFSYALYIFVFQMFFGWRASIWYALSLPVTGLLAYYYLRELQKLSAGLRNSFILLRAPFAARRLLALRAALIAEIESVDAEREAPHEIAV